jgi:DnaJ-class molecular chaperone
MIITPAQAHRANWIACDRCGGEGRGVDRFRAAWECTYCDGKGEVPRFPPRRPARESRCEPLLDRG